MAKRKKKARSKIVVTMPVPMLAFYEGVAAYAGVSLDDCFNIVLALGMLRNEHSKSP
jgi:hypothetical protein